MNRKRIIAGLALITVTILIMSGWYSDQAGAEYYQAPVINVQLPQSLNFTINPFETNGRGQIYSERHVVRNFSQNAVAFNIISIDAAFSNSAYFQPIPYAFGEEMSTDNKAIYLSMDFERYDLPSLVLTDPYAYRDISVPLEAYNGYNDEASSLAFSFSGNVNPNPATDWHWGDVKITMVYSLEVIGYEIMPEHEPTPTPYYPEETPEPIYPEPTAEPSYSEPEPSIPPEEPEA